MKLLLIDNYDSFTFNVVHLFASISDVTVDVRRNDEDFIGSVNNYDAIIIGPGPGSPEDVDYFGKCSELIRTAKIPILGICLGFQGISIELGAVLKKAPHAMHGKTSALNIFDRKQLLKDIDQETEVMRYHSLMIDTDKVLPKDMVVTSEVLSRTESHGNGREIMSIRHGTKPLYGVQFHPESFATISGQAIAENFVSIVRRAQ